MTGKTVTRLDLYAAVYKKGGLVPDGIFGNGGIGVKLSSFGSFIVRKKRQRLGRSPKTGVEVPISPRSVIVFRPSAVLKQEINGKRPGTKKPAAELLSSATR